MKVEVGAAQMPASGETVSGDAWTLVRSERAMLCCVADGLGHGPHAARAAEAACRYAELHPDDDLPKLLRGIDSALYGTRGAAVAVMRLDAASRKLAFAGIGNVEFRSNSNARNQPVPVPGIIGRGLRKVLVFEHALNAGLVLLLHTDGIPTHVRLEPYAQYAPQAMADAIVSGHRRMIDDATCVVMRIGVDGP